MWRVEVTMRLRLIRTLCEGQILGSCILLFPYVQLQKYWLAIYLCFSEILCSVFLQLLACVYAALILADYDVAITPEKITTILKAAGVEVEPYWRGLFAKALESCDLKTLITTVGIRCCSSPCCRWCWCCPCCWSTPCREGSVWGGGRWRHGLWSFRLLIWLNFTGWFKTKSSGLVFKLQNHNMPVRMLSSLQNQRHLHPVLLLENSSPCV